MDKEMKSSSNNVLFDPVIYQMQAELCHSMGHPARLQIMHVLFEGPKNVGEIAEITELSQSTVSRNLAILRQTGIVLSERRGQEIYYQVSNPKIIEVCNMMRTVLAEQIMQQSRMFPRS